MLKAKDSRNLRSGKGKMRNRRYVSRKGPLVIYGTEGAKIAKSFRNIPGVEVACVDRWDICLSNLCACIFSQLRWELGVSAASLGHDWMA